MSILYENLSELCEKKHISGYRMCKDCGISVNLMTELKSGRKESVSAEIAEKLSSYFGVSVSFLLGKETKKSTSTTTEEEAKESRIAKLQYLRDKQRILLAVSENASDEDIDKTISFLEYLTRRPNDAD